LVIFADILNKFPIYICRWPKKHNCLEELTGLCREKACAWCMKVAAEVMSCRWNSK